MNKTRPVIENQLKKDVPDFGPGDTISIDAVSYKHLTLPTICSV